MGVSESTLSERERFVEQGRKLLELAFDIGGEAGVTDQMEAEAMTTNGLLAIALTEIFAQPVHGRFSSTVTLRAALNDQEDPA